MRAARAYEGEREFRLEEIERPAVGAGEVLIQVESAGLAVGVLNQWERGMYPIMPRTLGHEAAGTVAELGAGVTDLQTGQRVRLHPNLSCRSCEFCLTDREQYCQAHSLIGQGIFGPKARPMHERYIDGALAEYVLAPGWAVDPLPESIPFDVAAKVHDVADALRAWKTAAAPPGATVVLTACTGAVGSAAIRMAHLFGASRVIAVARSAERLSEVSELAPHLVSTVAIEGLGDDWGETQALTRAIREQVPGGPDAVIDMFPDGPGTWQAVTSLKMGGTAVLMGSNTAMPPVPTIALMVNGWQLVGTRNCTREDARQVMEWLDRGVLEVEDLITHRFDLRDIAAAKKVVLERREPTRMVVVRP